MNKINGLLVQYATKDGEREIVYHNRQTLPNGDIVTYARYDDGTFLELTEMADGNLKLNSDKKLRYDKKKNMVIIL